MKVDLLEVFKILVILLKLSNVVLLVIRYIYGRMYYSGRGIILNKICVIGYWIISRSIMVRWFIFK